MLLSLLLLLAGPTAFKDRTAELGLALGNDAACRADFNYDGWTDLCAGGAVWRNWIELRLSGDGHAVNRSAIGAQVRIKLKGKTYSRQVEAGTGEGNQNDLAPHFGLGGFKGHVNVEIVWPNGKVQNLKHVATNRIVEIRFK
jgi:hypothetical protein